MTLSIKIISRNKRREKFLSVIFTSFLKTEKPTLRAGFAIGSSVTYPVRMKRPYSSPDLSRPFLDVFNVSRRCCITRRVYLVVASIVVLKGGIK